MKQDTKESHLLQTQSSNNIKPPFTFTQSKHSHSPHHFNHTSSNNAFSHLRNEITSLRQEFTKLIQKDFTKSDRNISKEKQEKQKKEMLGERRQNRIPFQSQIQQAKDKNHSEIDKQKPFSFKYNSNGTYSNHILNNISHQQKRKGSCTVQPSQYKFIVASLFDKQEDAAKQSLQSSTKIQQLEAEIINITNSKKQLQKELQIVRKESIKKELEFKDQEQRLKSELQKWKEIVDKIEISLAQEKQHTQQLIICLQEKSKEGKKEKDQYQQKINLLTQKFENQLLLLNRQLKSQQLKQENAAKMLMQIDVSSLEHQLEVKSVEINEQHLQTEQIIYILRQENQSMKQTQLELCFKIKQLETQLEGYKFGKNDETNTLTLEKIKANEIELIDLRKRVQSFKKSIENLNAVANSTREKLAQAKEELKQAKLENSQLKKAAQALIEDNKIKQALIQDLYKDIDILDKSIRGTSYAKSTLNINSKYIDALNDIIIELQCQLINYKYAETFQKAS